MDLAVDALATHRLVKLVTDDVITAPLREKIFEKYPPQEDSWSYALTCPWCAGIWIAAGVVAARRLLPKAWAPVAELLALSSAAGVIQEKL